MLRSNPENTGRPLIVLQKFDAYASSDEDESDSDEVDWSGVEPAAGEAELDVIVSDTHSDETATDEAKYVDFETNDSTARAHDKELGLSQKLSSVAKPASRGFGLVSGGQA